MPTTKDAAEAYRLGLVHGLVDPGRVVAWADRVIAACDVPDAAIISVSSAWAQGTGPIASALRQVPGRADPYTVIPLLLALLDEMLTRDPTAADDIARALYWIAVDEAMEGCDLWHELFGLGDAIDLAQSGTYGNLDEARAEVIRFVRTHRAAVPD
jgi:enoyl-CoA hydratase/carnithine racemase